MRHWMDKGKPPGKKKQAGVLRGLVGSVLGLGSASELAISVKAPFPAFKSWVQIPLK